MTNKAAKAKNIVKYLFLAGLIILCAILVVEALMPGDKSADTSNQVGDKVDDILTNIGKDDIHDIPPQSVAIVLNGSESGTYEMYCGDSVTPGVAFTPSDTSVNHKKLVYSSDNPTVLSVDAAGRMTAHKTGVASVKVTVADNETVFDTVSVEVHERYAVELSARFASNGKNVIEIKEGKTDLITVALDPYNATSDNITYVSSDKNVAKVSANGAVLAAGIGSAEITVLYTSQDGVKTLSDTLYVTVTENPEIVIPLESVAVDKTETDGLRYDADKKVWYMYAGESALLPVSLAPSNATEKTTVCSSDAPAVARASYDGGNLRVTALSKGNATICIASAADAAIGDAIEIEVRNKSLGVVLDTSGADITESGEENVYTMSITAGSGNISFDIRSENGAELYVNYEASDSSVAEITEDGKLLSYRSSENAENGKIILSVKVADNPDFSSRDGNLCEEYTIILTVAKQPFSAGVSKFQLFVRKLFGHFGAFLMLGILAAGTFILFSSDNWKSRSLHCLGAIAFGFTFACLTELFQSDYFTSGRGASFDDVILDCQGYLIALCAIYIVYFATVLIYRAVRARRKAIAAETVPQPAADTDNDTDNGNADS